MRSPPAIWYVSRYLPRSWRVKLLEALAWPEFEVRRCWMHEGRMDFTIPLHETLAAEAALPISDPIHPSDYNTAQEEINARKLRDLPAKDGQ